MPLHGFIHIFEIPKTLNSSVKQMPFFPACIFFPQQDNGVKGSENIVMSRALTIVSSCMNSHTHYPNR
jgi:hypothetical protein